MLFSANPNVAWQLSNEVQSRESNPIKASSNGQLFLSTVPNPTCQQRILHSRVKFYLQISELHMIQEWTTPESPDRES